MAYQKKLPVMLECGLYVFREVLYGKWKADLLWRIFYGVKRPGELQRKIPNATRRVLDTQLKELMSHGLITKTDYPGKQPKVEYELTALGHSLIPIIIDMVQWGEEHREVLEGVG